MKFLRLLFICLGISIGAVFPQNGDFFLKSYISPISNTDNQNLSAIQGDNGVMYFANTKGVISYDGVNWRIINTQSTTYSLGKDDQGTIYVGCGESFGYLDENIYGQTVYKPISPENKVFGEIRKIIALKDQTYFYTSKIVFSVSQENKKIKNFWWPGEGRVFRGFFAHNGRVFVNIDGKGLHRLSLDENEEDPIPLDQGVFFKDVEINTALEFDEDNKSCLIGTSDNRLYLFDGQTFSPYLIDSQDYLYESFLSGGINHSKESFILSTRSGGCLVVDKKSRKTLHTINYQTGLDDDEVLSITKDKQGGLWICNAYGISRADISLPILKYSDYPGLLGEITSVVEKDSLLYVATSEGIFYLAKVDHFSQIVKLVKQEKREIRVVERNIQTTIQVNPEPKVEIPEVNEEDTELESLINQIRNNEYLSEKKKKRLERRARKRAEKKSKNEDKKGNNLEALIREDEASTPNSEEVSPDTIVVKKEEIINPVDKASTSRTITQYVDTPVKETYALQSIPFIFTKVEGLQIKCKQMVPFQDKVLVATSLGLYEVLPDLKAKLIVAQTPINLIYRSPSLASRFFVATQNGLLILDYLNGNWVITANVLDLSQSIHSLVQDKNYLWLGGESEVFLIDLDESGNPLSIKNYDIPDDYIESPVVKMIDGEAVFIFSTGIYHLPLNSTQLVKHPKINRYFNPRSPVIYLQNKFTWIKPEGSAWMDIQKSDSIPENQAIFLSFFQKIQDIFIDKSKNIWVVDDNTLYKIQSDARLNMGQGFDVRISHIEHKKDLLALHNLSLPYQQNRLKIHLSAPYFLREKDIKYQYLLDGLDDSWSEWDSKTDILTVLPSGKYTIRVRAKNIFGQISEETSLSFEIRKPYWATTWFYLAGFLILMGVFYGLMLLRTRALSRANQKLEVKVTEKTQEISEQKKQLEIAFDEISQQKNQIQIANQELKKVNVTLEQKVEERTAKLKATLIQLLQTNRELDTFIYRASHDLKGPIARLMGLVNLAKMEDNVETVLHNLSLIEFTAHRMNKMLDKLIHIHSINSDAIDCEEMNVNDFLDYTRDKMKNIDGYESAYVIFKIEGPEVIEYDETLLGIILDNLLENAVHFQKRGPEIFPIVKLFFRFEADTIHIEVTDNGVGIPLAQQDQIFDMFFRGSELSTGNGLGLYLVKKATEKLGGSLRLSSEQGNITSFKITLPLAHLRQENEAPAQLNA